MTHYSVYVNMYKWSACLKEVQVKTQAQMQSQILSPVYCAMPLFLKVWSPEPQFISFLTLLLFSWSNTSLKNLGPLKNA